MLTTITHGIIDCDVVPFTRSGSTVTINVVNRKLLVALPHLQRQYLHVENRTKVDAWTNILDDCWLSIVVDKLGGVEYTVISDSPIISASEPISGQYWFDTNENCWKRRVGPNTFVREVMCVVAKIVGGVILPYRNTYIEQVFGATPPLTAIGEIVYDASTQKPITTVTPERYFVTTVDNVKSRTMSSTDVNFKNQTISCIAQESIPAFSVVLINEFEQAVVSPIVVSTTAGLLGIVTNGSTLGDVIDVHVGGLVTNISWDWSAVGPGVALYAGVSGQLTHVKPDPNAIEVAKTVDVHVVLFNPVQQSSSGQSAGGGLDPIVFDLGNEQLLEFKPILDGNVDAVVTARSGYVLFEDPVLLNEIQQQIALDVANPMLSSFGNRPMGTCVALAADVTRLYEDTYPTHHYCSLVNEVAQNGGYGAGEFAELVHVVQSCYLDFDLSTAVNLGEMCTGQALMSCGKLNAFDPSTPGLTTNVNVSHDVRLDAFGIGIADVSTTTEIVDYQELIAIEEVESGFYCEFTWLPVAHNNPTVEMPDVEWYYIPGLRINSATDVDVVVSATLNELPITLSDEVNVVEHVDIRRTLAVYPKWNYSLVDSSKIEFVDFDYEVNSRNNGPFITLQFVDTILNISCRFTTGLLINVSVDLVEVNQERLFVQHVTRGKGTGV